MKILKQFFNELDKRHIISIVFSVAVMFMVAKIIMLEIKIGDFVSVVIVNVFSGWVAAVAVLLLVFLERIIQNRCEDAMKFT